MPSPGGQFFSDEFDQDIEDYFLSDYWFIDQYIGDTLWTWGRNINGEIGDNKTSLNNTRTTPVTVFGGGTTWKQTGGGKIFSAAIKTDGTLWTWGRGDEGQLGINISVQAVTTIRSTPVTTILGGRNWRNLSVGATHIASIKTDGTLWNWGSNSSGQLGINIGGNTIVARSTPVTTILGGTNWKSVSCGGYYTTAIKTDGTLWSWGYNDFGQLGINDIVRRSTPVTTLLGGNNWKSVSTLGYTTAAIKTDGTLWLWGRNNFGQLGTNDITNRLTPVTTLLGGTDWKFIGSGFSHITTIKTNGTLWIWGANEFGQLGINLAGAGSAKSTPITTLLGGTDWKYSAGGLAFTTAIKTNGTTWIWGDNSFCQLGTNNNVGRSTPVTTLLGGNNWKSISCGWYHSLAVTAGQAVDLS